MSQCRGFDAVCTNDYARHYFSGCGLSYADVLESDILVLIKLLFHHSKGAIKRRIVEIRQQLVQLTHTFVN